MGQRKIELLSPARNIECGKAAIDHGADAVYIGTTKYGARTGAENSINDIQQLTNYAHLFGARVYLAINTILFEEEINDAVKLSWEGYHAGVDALIIQDMGLLECNLPPIPLHASTQTNNRTIEKVSFLEKVGFSQVVLARELNFNQIEEIHKNTGVALEFFIHGALCTSYSGQCYMSYYATGRSGNRGECSQMCRHKYSLFDSKNNLIVKDKYLLSLKDLNQSRNIESLIDSGISSFKIEGRLKGTEYVKNITAYYRKKIDAVISRRPDLTTSSFGKSFINFEPKPEKTFCRFFTSYFVNNEGSELANINSPKSVGEKIGLVTESESNWLIIDSGCLISNGDGLCYFNDKNELCGFRVNNTDGEKIFPFPVVSVPKETIIYRNSDIKFNDLLNKSNDCRKIRVNIKLSETECGIKLQIIDEQGIIIEIEKETVKQPANNPEKQITIIKQQLGKLGDSIFIADIIDLNFSKLLFIPSKLISDIRREAILQLNQKRLDQYSRQDRKTEPNSFPYPFKSATYEENIANSFAEKFYKRHGVEITEKAFELLPKRTGTGQLLMTTKYCLRKELKICLIDKKNQYVNDTALYIVDNTGRYRVEFDCKLCEMKIFSV